MRASFVLLFVMCAAVAACSKRNPELCCVTTAECERAGFDSPAPCAGSEVCVDNACQASGCDGDEDCAAPLMCSANQCVQPPDWVARHGGPNVDQGLAVTDAPGGDLVMSGGFEATTSLGGDALVAAGRTAPWIARYRATGAHLWSRTVGDATGASADGVVIDSNSDVYVKGSFLGPANFGSTTSQLKTGTFLVKLAGADGSYLWDHALDVFFTDVVGLSGNRVAICGSFSGTVDLGGDTISSTPSDGISYVLAVYDSSGAVVWAKALSTANTLPSGCRLVVVDDDLILAGTFEGSAMLGGQTLLATGTSDMFVARYRGSDGSHVWSIAHGGSADTNPLALAANESRVFVGGAFSGTSNLGGSQLTPIGTSDAFVAAYDVVNGSHLWSENFGGTNANDNATSIAASATKLAVSVQFYLSPITFGQTTLTPDESNLALVRLDPDTGVPSAVSQFSVHDSTQMALSIMYSGDQLAGIGTFSKSTTLLGTQLQSVGDTDIASFRVDF